MAEEVDGSGVMGKGLSGVWARPGPSDITQDVCELSIPEREPKLRECDKGMTSSMSGTMSDVSGLREDEEDTRCSGPVGRRGDRGGLGGEEDVRRGDDGGVVHDALSEVSVVLVESR